MDQGLLLKFRSLKSEYLNNCDIQIKMEAIIKGMRNDLKKLKNGSRQQYSSLNEILVRKKTSEAGTPAGGAKRRRLPGKRLERPGGVREF